jgi:hypothetical protein
MTRFQVTIDCADPNRLARFWCELLGYVVEPPPDGFATWTAYWRSRGVPPEEAGEEDWEDSIVDPAGEGPRIWFQQVPEPKTIKNRLHIDVAASGGRDVPLDLRRERVQKEADRLVALGASVAWVNDTPGVDHFGITMRDPEGNEFCLN